jgi:cytosine/adenosine deaminase-related metal-dependent hydrolase
LLKRRGTSVVWCPLSNVFLLGKTLAAERVVATEGIALGTDSSLTVVGGMFEALGCAVAQGVPPPKLYSMVTEAPARILRLPSGAATLAPGAPADWIALRDHGFEPGEALCGDPELELAVVGGAVTLVSDSLAGEHPALAEGMERLAYFGTDYWVRADMAALLARAEAELGDDLRLGGVWVRS